MVLITSLRQSLLQISRSSGCTLTITARFLSRGLKSTSPLKFHVLPSYPTTTLLRSSITLQEQLRSYSSSSSVEEKKELTPAQIPVKTHLDASNLKTRNQTRKT